MRTFSKWSWLQKISPQKSRVKINCENDLKNEDDPKNEDNLKNEDYQENKKHPWKEDNVKNEDYLNNEDAKKIGMTSKMSTTSKGRQPQWRHP